MKFVPEYCWRWSWAAEHGINLRRRHDNGMMPLRWLLWGGSEVAFVGDLVRSMANEMIKGEIHDG
jgi:hypothetical protein